jgi:hypothetical protein
MDMDKMMYVDGGLVRTGTIADGSCFFHAVLRAIDPKYSQLDQQGRMDYVKQVRKELAEKISPSLWSKLGDGQVALVATSEILTELLQVFFKVVKESDSVQVENADPVVKYVYQNFFVDDSLKSFKIFMDLVSPQELDALVAKALEVSSVNDLTNKLTDLVMYKLSDKIMEGDDVVVKSYLRQLYSNVVYAFTQVSSTAVDIAFKAFVKSVNSSTSWVDSYMIELLMDYFGIDVYVVDDSYKLYNMTARHLYKGRPSVLVLWTGNNHYESLGLLDKDTNEVVRVLEPDHPLVQNLRRMY